MWRHFDSFLQFHKKFDFFLLFSYFIKRDIYWLEQFTCYLILRQYNNNVVWHTTTGGTAVSLYLLRR